MSDGQAPTRPDPASVQVQSTATGVLFQPAPFATGATDRPRTGAVRPTRNAFGAEAGPLTRVQPVLAGRKLRAITEGLPSVANTTSPLYGSQVVPPLRLYSAFEPGLTV